MVAKLRVEVVKPVEPDKLDRFLTTGQELYGRCPLHGLCQVFVARYVSGREVVACGRCQKVLIEWSVTL